jgi:hypothetical protein
MLACYNIAWYYVRITGYHNHCFWNSNDHCNRFAHYMGNNL